MDNTGKIWKPKNYVQSIFMKISNTDIKRNKNAIQIKNNAFVQVGFWEEKMDRKFKVMGIYLGLLFFVSILLILVTSFSNNKMVPSYDVESEKQNQIYFEKTMEQSVIALTENNRVLREKVGELNSQLEEKNKLIEKYNNLYNDDVLKLQKAMSFYINGNLNELKNIIYTINILNLNEDYCQTYNTLIEKLN